MGDNLAFVDVEGTSGVHVLQVVTSLIHTCVLLSNNRVKCFGSNGWGQLGYGDAVPRGGQAGDMGDNLPFVDLEGTSGFHVLKISSGYGHTCALLSNNRVKCFGDNFFAQLGKYISR